MKQAECQGHSAFKNDLMLINKNAAS